MAFRCRRRPRANSEPIPPPPNRRNNHTVIIPIKMPSYNNHEVTEPKIFDWVVSFSKEHNRLPSTFEIDQEIRKWPDSKDAKWDATLSISFDCTERIALQWMMGESIDSSLKYRNPDPPPPFDENCTYNTILGDKCAICQGAEEGDKVGLWSCRCIYHEDCLRKAYKHSNKCPVCGCNINEYTTEEADGDVVLEVFV